MGASVRPVRGSRGEGDSVEMRIELLMHGDWTVLAITGELDLFSAPSLRERVQLLPAGRPVALDLSGVSFLDSSGLGAVIGTQKHVQASGGRFAVIAPTGSPLRRLLSLAGLDQVFASHTSRDELGVAS